MAGKVRTKELLPKRKRKHKARTIGVIKKNATAEIQKLKSNKEEKDWFKSSYSGDNQIIQPPFNLKVLANTPDNSTKLGQCIEVMEINIDGFGGRFIVPLGKKDREEFKDKIEKEMDIIDDVFGVISESPAYLMNSHADGLPVALTGRVDVLVHGPVRKGQRIVSSNTPGVGIAVDNNSIEDVLTIVGRALESSDNSEVKLIECAVGKL